MIKLLAIFFIQITNFSFNSGQILKDKKYLSLLLLKAYF